MFNRMEVRWYTTSKYSSRSTAVTELRNSKRSSGSSHRCLATSTILLAPITAASGCASTTAPGNFCSIRCAMSRPVRTAVIASHPLQRVLAPRIQKAESQDQHERHHSNEAGHSDALSGDRPRIEKNRLY